MKPCNKTSLYADVTTRIIAELEEGRLPWEQPWSAEHLSTPLGLPKNAATGRAYSGINILILWDAAAEHIRSTQRCLTFRQADLCSGPHSAKGRPANSYGFKGRANFISFFNLAISVW